MSERDRSPIDQDRCTVCRAKYPTTGQQAGTVWSVWGPGFHICRWCVQAGRDERRRREQTVVDYDPQAFETAPK